MTAQRTLAVAAAADQASCQDEAGNGCRTATDQQRRAAGGVPSAAFDVRRRLQAVMPR